TCLGSVIKYRSKIKEQFLLEIGRQIENDKEGERVDYTMLEKTIKTVTPVQIEEETIIDEFKYIYWEKLFSDEIESKYGYLIETVMAFRKYRRKNKNHILYFDEYLFTKEDNKRLFGCIPPVSFALSHGLSSELLTPGKERSYDS
ncbi:hypothetical protein MUP35_01095, partial [Patescibacteria group bacterium]|nr:hypothetical protein [Patescibacteria group bacterium]